jgi:flavin reductase (DIM6/NTAB) family NADH-FMN oxidoreductase RutF
MPDFIKRRDALAAVASVASTALFSSGAQAAESTPPTRRPIPGMVSELSPEVEARKKNAFIMIPYGMFVLGVTDGESLYAGTINWVMQSAYKEPLFTMGVRRPGEFGLPYDDEVYRTLVKTGKFSLSFLGESQADIARAFLQSVTVEEDTINGYKFHTEKTGGPILDDAPAWFEAEVHEEMAVGDHSIFICKVINAGNTVEQKLLMDRDATRRPRSWLTDKPA